MVAALVVPRGLVVAALDHPTRHSRERRLVQDHPHLHRQPCLDLLPIFPPRDLVDRGALADLPREEDLAVPPVVVVQVEALALGRVLGLPVVQVRVVPLAQVLPFTLPLPVLDLDRHWVPHHHLWEDLVVLVAIPVALVGPPLRRVLPTWDLRIP